MVSNTLLSLCCKPLGNLGAAITGFAAGLFCGLFVLSTFVMVGFGFTIESFFGAIFTMAGFVTTGFVVDGFTVIGFLATGTAGFFIVLFIRTVFVGGGGDVIKFFTNCLRLSVVLPVPHLSSTLAPFQTPVNSSVAPFLK